ncbi:FAD-binding domain-containing protein [Coprinopsis marcescibilis]|uniref:FAD-binding domain-containing protein n=1 Tax=Coprinopsis marcescibilis TaxID=230819 RepID=A0A5C3KHE1_COPMA|nr:FAD-binding domain-containing protein [Coprinopsis marcescibilis]
MVTLIGLLAIFLVFSSSSTQLPPVVAQSSGPLEDALGGKGFDVAFPGDPLFVSSTEAFNRRYSVKPAAVAFPSTSQQVGQIVRAGYEFDYKVVARSGGHSYAAHGLGTEDGAILIDLSRFKHLKVDTDTNTAVIGAGNRLGEIVLGLSQHGRALPHGTCAYVGWGGHATLGGYGFTSRLWGLSLDAIEEVEVVLGNGTAVVASQLQNRALFAVPAPYLGIVTSIKVRTFAAPPSATIFNFNWHLSIKDATAAIAAYQRYVLTANIPAHLGIQGVITRASIQGNISFGLVGGWYGPSIELNGTLKGLIDAMPYPPRAMNFDTGDYLHSAENLAGGSLDTTTPGGRDTFYAKSLITPSRSPLSTAAIRAFVTTFATEGFASELGWWFIQLDLFGGRNSAITKPSTSSTAFPHRDALFGIQLYGSTRDNVPPYPDSGFTFLDNAVNSILKNSPREWDYGAYTNYIDDRQPNGASCLSYYKEGFETIKRIKRVYDPKSVFAFPTRWLSEEVAV